SKAEYDKKVKNAELEKLKNSIKNSTIKSEMAGTVKKINSLNAGGSSPDNMYGDNTDADVVMTIIASGDFRVKGTINEQNMMAVSADMPVIIRSRADETVTWNGTITEIGSEPVQNNSGIMYGGDSDEMTTSSKYPFYVSLDSNEGLMLGQHVIIEPDYGQSGMEEKSGVWIYEDYIVTDDN
ncbi:MAG: HlyD family secretion protein, partial [Oscillospiraceae bacterium]|nr:HlyD family secretion protein [Oscillospiraceae bacterium]